MSQVVLFTPVRAVTRLGVGIAGAEARFFASQTTTPVTVYSDEAVSVAHPVPLVADANGVFPPVFYQSAGDLKVEVRDPDGVMLDGYPIDPVLRASLGGSAAATTFEATAEVPETNVQDAIESLGLDVVAANAAITPAIQAVGLGVTGVNRLLSSWTATNLSSGQYRATVAGTSDGASSPTGAAGNFTVDLSRSATNTAVMRAVTPSGGPTYRRVLDGGVWQSWQVMARPLAGHATAAWEAGTSTDLDLVSPAQVAAAIEALSGGIDLVGTFASATGNSYVTLTGLSGVRVLELRGQLTPDEAVSRSIQAQLSSDNGETWGAASTIAVFADGNGGLLCTIDMNAGRILTAHSDGGTIFKLADATYNAVRIRQITSTGAGNVLSIYPVTLAERA